MDIWQALRTTGRRWYVALPVVALGVVASYVLADRVAIEYTSEASMVLVNPEAATELPATPLDPDDPDTTAATTAPPVDAAGNPWLSFSGSLNTTAQAIQLSVLSQETVRGFEEAGLSPDYEVGTDRRNPILLLKVTSDDPEVTQRTLQRLVELINEDLTSRQEAAGAPTDRRIHAEVLAIDDIPERLVAARLRVRLATLALGVVGAILAAVAVDTLAAGRRRDRVPARSRVELEHSQEDEVDRSAVARVASGVEDEDAVAAEARRVLARRRRPVDEGRPVTDEDLGATGPHGRADVDEPSFDDRTPDDRERERVAEAAPGMVG